MASTPHTCGGPIFGRKTPGHLGPIWPDHQRVTFTQADGTGRTTVFLRILIDGPTTILGELLDRDGAPASTVDCDGVETRTSHFISTDLIVKRVAMRQTLDHGTWVSAGPVKS